MSDEVYLKIQRADKHISELHAELDAFKATTPYAIDTKRDADTGEHVAFIVSAKPLPERLPLIAGDVIQNLYSALDYLAWQLVIANGKVPTSKTAFPIAKNIPTTKDEIARYEGQVNGMRDDAKNIIKGLKPFRGQGNSFWRLHKLNNINKHRSFITLGFNTQSVAGFGDLAERVKLLPGPLEEGCIFARFPRDADDPKHVQFTFDVTLHEPEADALWHPLVLDLRICYNTVFRAVEKFWGCR